MLTAIGWGFIKKKRLKWTLAVLVPYSFAHSLYWLPVWLGGHPSEFSSWAFLFIAPWSLAGAQGITVLSSINSTLLYNN
jgi:hypothetical protein